MSLDITSIAQKLIDSLEGEQQRIKWITEGVFALHEAIIRKHEELINGQQDNLIGRETEETTDTSQQEE